MPFGQYNLTRIQSLQPALQPLAQRLLDAAAEQGINLEITQGYRSPEAQQALYTSGAGVTNAPALSSYHNYGLAFDVVPEDYANMKDWNPTGDLWPRLGALGESLGLEWGGRWSHPDRPHFQIPESAAPISELKAYYQKAMAAGKSVAEAIMPIAISPAGGSIVAIVLVGLAWWFWLRPLMQERGYL